MDLISEPRSTPLRTTARTEQMSLFWIFFGNLDRCETEVLTFGNGKESKMRNAELVTPYALFVLYTRSDDSHNGNSTRAIAKPQCVLKRPNGRLLIGG